MNAHTLLAFSALALVTTATPGPTVLLAMTNGSRYGTRVAAPGILGAITSDVVLIGAVALGLGALLSSSAMLFAAVKWLGVAYLAYLGLRLLRSHGSLEQTKQKAEELAGSRQLFVRSFLVAVTNPKAYLFFAALLPQFIEPGLPLLPQYTVLAVIFASIDGFIVSIYSFAGTRAVSLFQGRGSRWMEKLCGTTMLGLAASLAFYAVPHQNT
jgi:threonine/homoserine/homoserine lactone efflux protein